MPATRPARSASSAAARRIVAAARRSFLAHGFARFTMDELAAELGMSKKTLYAHFPTKDALVHAVIEDKIASFKSTVQAVVASPDADFPQRAHRVITAVIGQMSEVSPAFLRDLERLQPEVFVRIQAVRREILPQVWSKLLTAGIQKGQVRADLEIPFFCEVVLLAVEGLMRPAAMDRFGLAPSQIITRLLSLLFAGVLTPAGRKAYEL